MRAETAAGRGPVAIEEGTFSYAEYRTFLEDNEKSISEFREVQAKAFEEEKQRWHESGEFDVSSEPVAPALVEEAVVPEGSDPVKAPLASTLWQLSVEEGDVVEEGQQLLSLEAMKMETPVVSPVSGKVTALFAKVGDQVTPGRVLLSIEPS